MRLIWLTTACFCALTPTTPAVYRNYVQPFWDDPSRYGGDTIPGSMSGAPIASNYSRAVPTVAIRPVIAQAPRHATHHHHARKPRVMAADEHRPARSHQQVGRFSSPELPKDEAVVNELQQLNYGRGR